jgi:hypothetical protein
MRKKAHAQLARKLFECQAVTAPLIKEAPNFGGVVMGFSHAQ